MLRRAFLHISEPDRAQPRDELRRFLEGHVAMRHVTTSLDQIPGSIDQLLECRVSRSGSDPESGSRAYHAPLEFGNFGQGFFDRVLDGANLCYDLECSGFNNVFTHDSSPLGAGRPAKGHEQQFSKRARPSR